MGIQRTRRDMLAQVWAALLLGAHLLIPNQSFAQGAAGRSADTILTTRSVDAGIQAIDFAEARNHVGVIVYYGPDQNPREIGDAFVAELRRRGVIARAFAAPVQKPGAAVSFYVGSVGRGPWGVDTAASRMSEAVELSRARDRLLSPGYVPPR